jgi:hypothetical protein
VHERHAKAAVIVFRMDALLQRFNKHEALSNDVNILHVILSYAS